MISPPGEGRPCRCVVRDNKFKGRPGVKQETCMCVDAVLITVTHTNMSLYADGLQNSKMYSSDDMSRRSGLLKECKITHKESFGSRMVTRRATSPGDLCCMSPSCLPCYLSASSLSKKWVSFQQQVDNSTMKCKQNVRMKCVAATELHFLTSTMFLCN